MVRYRDGAVMAQLGIPDMRIPIAYALSYPERLDVGLAPLNLQKQGELTFLNVESRRYPALDIAYGALARGGTVPPVLKRRQRGGGGPPSWTDASVFGRSMRSVRKPSRLTSPSSREP